jgi:hypothetical protein
MVRFHNVCSPQSGVLVSCRSPPSPWGTVGTGPEDKLTALGLAVARIALGLLLGRTHRHTAEWVRRMINSDGTNTET